MDFFNNDLVIEIINAENWKDALFKHSKLCRETDETDEIYQSYFGNTLADAKIYAFNCDMMIDVIEIYEDEI